MIGISNNSLTLSRAPKHAPPHEHDTVRRVRLFNAVSSSDVGVATEIDDRHAERFDQHPPRALRSGRFTRKNLQASVGVHTPNTREQFVAPPGKSTKD
jgi:hypothetical protein